MNANELAAMRRRLQARQAAEGGDHPLLLGLAGILFAALFIVVNFI